MSDTYNKLLIQNELNNARAVVNAETENMRRLLYNEQVLKQMTQHLGEEYHEINNAYIENKSESSLKMQRQDDIRNQIDHDSNVIVFSGLGLTVVFITVLLLYMK